MKARDNEVEVATLDQDFCTNKDMRGVIKIMKLKLNSGAHHPRD